MIKHQRHIARNRKVFDLRGTPVRIEFRTGKNPYSERRKKLTPKKAMVAKRQRRIARGRKPGK